MNIKLELTRKEAEVLEQVLGNYFSDVSDKDVRLKLCGSMARAKEGRRAYRKLCGELWGDEND